MNTKHDVFVNYIPEYIEFMDVILSISKQQQHHQLMDTTCNWEFSGYL